MCHILYAGVSRGDKKKRKKKGCSKQVSEAQVPPPKLAPRLTGVNQAASGPLSWNTVSTTKGSGAAFSKV